MVPDHLRLLTVVDHVDVAVVVGVSVARMRAIDLDGLIDRISSPVHGQTLRVVPDSEVL